MICKCHIKVDAGLPNLNTEDEAPYEAGGVTDWVGGGGGANLGFCLGLKNFKLLVLDMPFSLLLSDLFPDVSVFWEGLRFTSCSPTCADEHRNR